MKTHIHPDYRYLEKEIKDIVYGDYVPVKVFCNRRNVVEKVTLAGKEFVVKKFKRPTFLNRIAYTLFRKTKARRAFDYALVLLEHGVRTPAPVAYIEVSCGGLFHTGYFISEYLDCPTLADLLSSNYDIETIKRLLKDFIHFTIDLHSKGILPLDYNPSNIFYIAKEDGHFDFALTDINRTRFGKLWGNRDAMRCFEQLGVSTEHLYHFLLGYTIETGYDIDVSMFRFLYYRIRKRGCKRVKDFVKMLVNAGGDSSSSKQSFSSR